VPASGDIVKKLQIVIEVDGQKYTTNMQAAAGTTEATTKSVSGLNRQLGELRGTMAGVAQQFGAGGFGSLLGATSLAAATVAVAGIIAQAMRMAYVFEQTSARVAANLAVAPGANIVGAYNAVQNSVLSQTARQRYGFSAMESLQGLGAYQSAAGATQAQTLASQSAVLPFARATGLSAVEAGASIGALTRITEESPGRAAGTLYGGMGEAGQLGRDIRGYISATQTVLTQLAMGAPGTRFTTGQAAQLTADVGAAGGIYSLPQTVTGLSSAVGNMMSGLPGNPFRMVTAMRAHIPMLDIIQGVQKPEYSGRMIDMITKQYGWNSGVTSLWLTQMMGSQDEATKLIRMPAAARAKYVADLKSGKEAPMGDYQKKAGDLMGTPYGKLAVDVATISDEMQKLGKKAIEWTAQFIDTHHWTMDGAKTLIQWLPIIGGGLATLTTFFTGFNILKGIGGIAKFLGGARGAAVAGEAGEVATVAGEALTGIAALPEAVVGAGVAVAGTTIIGGALLGYKAGEWARGKYDAALKPNLRSDNPGYDVMSDYLQNWAGSNVGGRSGIQPQFRHIVDQLVKHGESMGIYDFHHGSPVGYGHMEGRAMDVSTINGQVVGNTITPNVAQFIKTALALDPHVVLGVPGAMYAKLGSMGGRLFPDTDAHIHVQLGGMERGASLSGLPSDSPGAPPGAAGTTHRTTKTIDGKKITVTHTTNVQVTPAPRAAPPPTRTSGVTQAARPFVVA
jgi:hypothetical protein